MKDVKIYFTGLLLTFISTGLMGQAALSPYSTLGIGDVKPQTMVHNEGMGGLGLSKGYGYWMNYSNPALLVNNYYTVFGMSLFGDFRNYEQGGNTGTSGGANLGYLATAFPLKDYKWTMAIGLNPYSSVNYNYNFTGTINGTQASEVVLTEKGEGGINQFNIATGYNVFKNFNLGLKASYMFGAIKRESSNIVVDPDPSLPAKFIPVIFDRQNVSDFVFSGGASYKYMLSEETELNLGVVYDLEMNLNARRLTRIETRNLNNSAIQVDTVNDNTKSTIVIPPRLGAGFSIAKDLKWTFGTDIYFQDWSLFQNFEGSNPGFSNTYKVVVGGEFVPDINNTENYLSRMTYRLGLNIETIPYTFNGDQMSEFGINIGWSLPVGRISVLDFAVRYGERGTTENNLIKERFFRFFFGATFNDKWFQRRKYY